MVAALCWAFILGTWEPFIVKEEFCRSVLDQSSNQKKLFDLIIKMVSSCKPTAIPQSVCVCVCVFCVMCLFTVWRKTALLRSAKSCYCSGDRLFSALVCVSVCCASLRHTVTLLPAEHATCHNHFPLDSSRTDFNAHFLMLACTQLKILTAKTVFSTNLISHKETHAVWNDVRDLLHADWWLQGQTERWREVERQGEKESGECFVPISPSVSLLGD